MKKILSVLAFVFSVSANATVVSAFVWEAPTGHAPAMFENGMKAKAMHEAMGAGVFIGQGQRFRMYYVMRSDSAAARGAVMDTLSNSAEWQQFMGEAASREGASSLVEVYNMTLIAETEGGPGGEATVVFQYRPNPGAAQAVIASTLKAKQLHEKMGARVQILLDETGLVHYITQHESWAAQGAFEDEVNGGQNKEWDAFWEGGTSNPSAVLEDVIRITQVAVSTMPE